MTLGATTEELQELARRSRRTASSGALSLIGTLMMFPVVALVIGLAPGWYAWTLGGALVAGGLMFTRFAFVAGQERGAFRSVFARVRAEKELAKATVEARRVPIEGPAAEPVVARRD